MSDRVSYALAALLLLSAAVFRFWDLTALPPGLADAEIDNLRIVETARQGRIEVFYALNGEGHEGLYQMAVAAVTSVVGSGLIGYRLVSLWAGLITLALVYALGKRLFGPLAAVTAAAVLAVGMAPAVLARGIAPETLLPLFVTGVLLALARSLPVYGTRPPPPEPRTIPFASLGILLGLGFYIHPASYAVALLSIGFIVYMVLARQPLSQRTLSYTWFALVVALVMATPYVISTLQFPDLAGIGRLIADFPDLAAAVTAAVNGLLGVLFLGDMNPVQNLPGRPLLDLVSGLLFTVGLITALYRWRQPRHALLLIGAALLLPVALLASNSPNFFAFAPLLPLIALFIGLGLITLLRGLPRTVRPYSAAAISGLLLFNVVWTARDLFGAWPQLPAMQRAYHRPLGQLAVYLDETAHTINTIICSSDLRLPPAPPELTDRQILSLMIHQPDLPVRNVDCGTALVLPEGGATAQFVMPEGGGLAGVYPYLRANWLAWGEWLTAPYVPPESVLRLQVTDALADQIGSFTTTTPVAFAPESPGGVGLVSPPVRFGGNLAFLGYDPSVINQTYAPGDVIGLTTYWRVDGLVPADLRLFTHILADPAVIAAQNDTISVLPEQLRPRDVFIQVTFIDLPHAMPSGDYSLSVGAYPDSSSERLVVFDGALPRGDRLFLGPITVQRGDG
ncbi:MAG: glycosyltransferase family 39 protein [Chloroflexi bacterium]|nr:glycosyltransferase family 39 protein [Chloroflexota bacterium]